MANFVPLEQAWALGTAPACAPCARRGCVDACMALSIQSKAAGLVVLWSWALGQSNPLLEGHQHNDRKETVMVSVLWHQVQPHAPW